MATTLALLSAFAALASAQPAPPDWGCDALAAAGAFDSVTLFSPSGALSLSFIPYGGTAQSLRVPGAGGGRPVDVLLGFDDASQYCRGEVGDAGHPYFGALIGRVANRISRGTFSLDGAVVHTPINEPPPSGGNDTLHGGTFGYDRRVWAVQRLNASAARLSYFSPDGEMGFPGDLNVSVTYTLTEGSWVISYAGVAGSKDTVFAPTQHAYWNLNGGAARVLEHTLAMPTASRFVQVDAFLLPTGALGSVSDAANAFLDFTAEKPVGRDINATTRYSWGTGYDNAWVFDSWAPDGPVAERVRVFSPLSGIGMVVSSDQPSVQVYSGNFLNNSIPQVSVAGARRRRRRRRRRGMSGVRLRRGLHETVAATFAPPSHGLTDPPAPTGTSPKLVAEARPEPGRRLRALGRARDRDAALPGQRQQPLLPDRDAPRRRELHANDDLLLLHRAVE